MKKFRAVVVVLLFAGVAIIGCAREVHHGGPAPPATTRAVEEIDLEGGAPPPGMRVSYPGVKGQAVEKSRVTEEKEVVR